MGPSKILVAYFPKPPIIEYMKRAFEKKGIKVEGYYSDTNNWFDKYVIHYVNKTAHNLRLIPKSKVFFKDHPMAHLQYRSRKFLEKVQEYSPDLVILVRGWRITEEALTGIRKIAPVYGWWIEKEDRMEEPFKEAHLFDHYFFMNSSCVEEGVKRGFKHFSLLHHSVDTKSFYPVECEKRYDWCFVGGWSPRRMAIIEKALKISKNGVIYGPKWLKKNPLNYALHKIVKSNYIGGDALAKLYGETKVVLNITNWGGKDRTGMNMRVLEVPACRAFLLTDGSKDINNVITPGEHVVLYEDHAEFERKLEYYIKNEEERARIAERGYKHVVSFYTYDELVGRIIEVYNK